MADPDQLEDDTATLIGAAPALTEKQLAIAIRHAAALLRPEKDAEHLAERQRSARALFKSPGPAGMSTYRLVLDPEGAAILDAAIDPLARPQPIRTADRSRPEPDLRTPAARRADALLAIIGRGVSSPGKAPKTAKAQLVVTMSLEQLTGAVRGAGLTLGQELLTAGTVRRLACDADLIPAVLGTRSELLDVGRRKRLVPPAIRLAAWLRDGGCTYPGCTVPAQWCDAHHGIPWWEKGDTALDNTALLCGTAPHPGPRPRPDLHHHRHARHLAPVTAPPHTPSTPAGPRACPDMALCAGHPWTRPSIVFVALTDPPPAPHPAGLAVSPLQGFLLALLFLVEVLGLVAVAWWSVSLGGLVGIVVAVISVSAMAGLWGLFAAPKATRRLQGVPLAVFMLAWFAVGGICLAALGHPWWGVALVAGFALVKGLLRLTGYRHDSSAVSPPAA